MLRSWLKSIVKVDSRFMFMVMSICTGDSKFKILC
ncbi:unnamed protein product [Linum tenue]|uniref:Uncharacterized protein n=1 Tax=Linum tenue TaxID=586396 RepID=A0AAV0LNJ8_9ROSI|nr:unnamed protein product [Linum tenue]